MKPLQKRRDSVINAAFFPYCCLSVMRSVVFISAGSTPACWLSLERVDHLKYTVYLGSNRSACLLPIGLDTTSGFVED